MLPLVLPAAVSWVKPRVASARLVEVVDEAADRVEGLACLRPCDGGEGDLKLLGFGGSPGGVVGVLAKGSSGCQCAGDGCTCGPSD